jgi:flagellar hook-associated protein 1 FlgK
MPLSTFLGLETTLRGILAQQLALDVTGHNIANANTVGYSRQSAVMATTEAYTVPGVSRPPQAGQLGTGVDVQSYQRMRDEFLDIQYRAQSMRQGSAQATQDGLLQIEVAFNEPSDSGLNSLLQSYWAAWHDVSNTPENLATRQALAQNAASLANGFQNLATQLQTVQSQVAQNVTDTIAQVNAIGTQITQLTAAITADELTGDKPNDLLDQRDVLIDQLSKLGNVTVTVGALDTVDITFGGATLVSGGTAQAAVTESDMTSLTSGKLSGLIGLRDTAIPGYQTSLDNLASTLITETNTLHGSGYDLSGNLGGAFFTGTDAASIAVNPALLLTPALIAASANGQPGNAGNALAIADMQRSAQAGLGGATIDTSYSQLVTQLGSDVRDATQTTDNATILAGSLDDKRQSVSGVSLDEEMTNLVKFQRGYQASSRALSAMDEMIDQLINRTGRVGL